MNREWQESRLQPPNGRTAEEVTITRRQADEALRNYLTTSGNENDTYFSYMSTLGFNPGETKR